MRPLTFLLWYSFMTTINNAFLKSDVKHGSGFIQIFDRFGFETTLIHAGGHITFSCYKNRGGDEDRICDGSENFTLVDPDGRILKTEICKKGATYVEDWRINVTEKTKFGTYKCHMNGKPEQQGVDISYIICDDRGHICRDGPACKNNESICVLTATQNKSCSKMVSRELCARIHDDSPGTQSHICPASVYSLCHAFLGNYSKAWLHVKSFTCEPTKLAGLPRLSYQNKIVLYGESIQLNSSRKNLSVYHVSETTSRYDGQTLQCTVKTSDLKVVDAYNNVTVTKLVSLQLRDHIFARGSQVYKFGCNIFQGDILDVRARLSATLIFLGGDLVAKPNADGNLECSLQPAPADLHDFIIDFWWVQQSNNATHKGAILHAPKEDMYQCHANITYRSCTPWRVFHKGMKPTKFEPAAPINAGTTFAITRFKWQEWEQFFPEFHFWAVIFMNTVINY